MSDSEISEKLANTHLDDQQSSAEESLDFSKLKRKKKQVVIKEPPTKSADNDDDIFAGLKKKKSVEHFASELEMSGDKEDFDLSSLKKKKKKKSKNLAAFEAELGEEESEEKGSDVSNKEGEPWLGTDRDYTYQELLTRFYKILKENNPELAGEKRRYTIVPPQVIRDGKKSIFANLNEICKRMHRPPEHVIHFLFAELGTSGSIDGAGRLIIKGRFQQKQLEHVLRRYIVEYVTCKTCKSGDTILTKENRLYFIQCESCGSTRSVAPIKTGFQAQTTKRSVARRAAQA